MRIAKNPWYTFGKVSLIVGAALSAAALIFLITGIFFNGLYVLMLLSGIFGIQGLTWLIIGVCTYFPLKNAEAKLARLKKEGFAYDAEIINLIPNYRIRVGGALTVYAECSYINRDGMKCLVKSGSFLLEYLNFVRSSSTSAVAINPEAANYPANLNIDGLKAKVYVNPRDPKDYAVEIYSAQDNIKFDYDYR
jgi:membrane protein implicated in regulation of membrane protease activity